MKEYKILSMDKAVIRKNSIRTEHLRNQLLSKPGTKLRLEAIQNVTMFHRAEKVAARVFAQHSAHVLVEGSLVNSTYEQPNGKGKKSKTMKITSRSIRADVVRKLDHNEQELPTPPNEPTAESDEAPF